MDGRAKTIKYQELFTSVRTRSTHGFAELFFLFAGAKVVPEEMLVSRLLFKEKEMCSCGVSSRQSSVNSALPLAFWPSLASWVWQIAEVL